MRESAGGGASVDQAAATIFGQSRAQKLRIGTNNLAIAAITLAVSGIQIVTTEFVPIEIADALSAPSVRAHTVAFINGLRQ
jgi:hypothetical protein